GFEPPFSEVYLHYGAQRQVRFRPRAGASAALTRLAAQYFDGGGTLRTEAFVQFETFLSAAARLDPDLRCYEDALNFVAQVRDAERREKVLAEVFQRGIRSAGFRRSRDEGLRAESFCKIMNYDTVYRDLDLITAWSPDLVILDEAQRIKNWNTRTARSVKKIASPYAMVLTGTPLENRLEDLVSIVQFVDQHRLGPTFRFLHDHQILDEFG